jgi:hypothetical protein
VPDAGQSKGNQGIFGIHADFLKCVQGGFFMKKKPLGITPSLSNNWGTAAAGPLFLR